MAAASDGADRAGRSRAIHRLERHRLHAREAARGEDSEREPERASGGRGRPHDRSHEPPDELVVTGEPLEEAAAVEVVEVVAAAEVEPAAPEAVLRPLVVVAVAEAVKVELVDEAPPEVVEALKPEGAPVVAELSVLAAPVDEAATAPAPVVPPRG